MVIDGYMHSKFDVQPIKCAKNEWGLNTFQSLFTYELQWNPINTYANLFDSWILIVFYRKDMC